MTDPTTQAIRDDLAFLRGLTQDDARGLARDGVVMVVLGVVFGVVNLLYWLIFTDQAPALRPMSMWLWVIGLVAFFGVAGFVSARLPRPTGAASRAMAAAWSGTGLALVAPNVGLVLAGARLGNPQLVLWIFPIILFTLYGAAWAVAFAVKRRAWFAVVATGCFAAAFVEGLLYSSPHQWLALSIGLVLWVAIPGWVIIRQSRALA